MHGLDFTALDVTNKRAILTGEVVFLPQFTSSFIFGNFQMVSFHFAEVCKCLTVETSVSTFGRIFSLICGCHFCFKRNKKHGKSKDRNKHDIRIHVTSLRVVWRKGFV